LKGPTTIGKSHYIDQFILRWPEFAEIQGVETGFAKKLAKEMKQAKKHWLRRTFKVNRRSKRSATNSGVKLKSRSSNA